MCICIYICIYVCSFVLNSSLFPNIISTHKHILLILLHIIYKNNLIKILHNFLRKYYFPVTLARYIFENFSGAI